MDGHEREMAFDTPGMIIVTMLLFPVGKTFKLTRRLYLLSGRFSSGKAETKCVGSAQLDENGTLTHVFLHSL